MKTILALASCLALLACNDRNMGKQDPINNQNRPDAPAGRPDSSVQSLDAPVRGWDAPVQSWDAPVQSWDAPVQSWDAPVQSSDARAQVWDAPRVAPDASLQTPDAAFSAPDAGFCLLEETCKEGAKRLCDGATYCNWGEQTCGPDGKWGVCNENSQAPAGCQGPQYDLQCCVANHYCCQSWDGTSTGNCPDVTQQCRQWW